MGASEGGVVEVSGVVMADASHPALCEPWLAALADLAVVNTPTGADSRLPTGGPLNVALRGDVQERTVGGFSILHMRCTWPQRHDGGAVDH